MFRIFVFCAAFLVITFAAQARPTVQDQREEDQAGLRAEAKVSMQEAEKTALAKEPGAVSSRELENEDGRAIYSFDIQTAHGIREVHVDAATGTVVADAGESKGAESIEHPREAGDRLPIAGSVAPVRTKQTPLALVNTGEFAENIYDAAFGTNWSEAKRKLAALQHAVRSLPSTLHAKAEIESTLLKLDSSIRAGDRIKTLEQSNLITRLAAEESAAYRPTPPVQVSLLDYYGRELQIGAETSDAAALRQAAIGIKQAWEQIRSETIRRSPSQASRFDRLVAAISSAQHAPQYARLAATELEQVDALEKIFETSGKPTF